MGNRGYRGGTAGRIARWIATAIAVLMAVAAAACSSGAGPADDSNGAESAATGGPKYGGILRLANRGEPSAGFDSLRTSSIALHHVGGALFGPGNLVMRCRENTFEVCPYLASRWTHSPDFAEWSFTIRDGVFWHDGTPFDAEDAKFWLDLAYFGAAAGKRVRAPAYFKGELGDIEAVEVGDGNVLRVRFTTANPRFLDALANPRFKIAHPRHLMQPLIAQGDISVSPLDVGLVGLGPFALDEYTPGSVVRVRRFDRYWETADTGAPLPYLDGIDYVIMEDALAMDIAIRSGRLDGGARGQGHYLSPERKEGYARDLGDDVQYGRMEGGMFRLAFNVLNEGPWQDPRIRRAIALWIDKPAAIPSAVAFGWAPSAANPEDDVETREFMSWPGFDIAPLTERRAVAKQLMAEAGYSGGFEMDHLCRTLNTAPCEFLKAQLAGLGIDLRLHILDETEWNAGRVSLDYDSEQGRLTPPLVPEATISVYGRYSENPDAYAKHEDPVVDDLYERLLAASDHEERVEIWREIERYLFVEQTYVVPIAQIVNEVAYRGYVEGLAIPTEDGHANTDFATVWLDD